MKSIKSLALEYFDLVGFAKAESPLTIDTYEKWLKSEKHGDMEYLERHLERKKNPNTLLKGAHSWIVMAHYYDTKEPLSEEIKEELIKQEKGWISRYARGRDYHDVILEKLNKLIARLKELYPNEEFVPCVDFRAVLERDTAQRAGLGWIGKNTCLINTQIGSFVFLTEILTTLSLETDSLVADHCGNCTRCLDACPTGALEGPRELNATKCISYWTIESKKTAPETLAKKFGVNIFGCDICQDVCPWNQKARKQNALLPENPHALKTLDLREFLKLDVQQVKKMIKNTALERAGAEKLLSTVSLRSLSLFKNNLS